jgi:hypothetical protein
VRIACPSDDQIKDAAIAASRATYFKAPSGGTCPCRYDTYAKGGETLVCGGLSVEAKTGWVMCRPEQVPTELVTKLKARMPECFAR